MIENYADKRTEKFARGEFVRAFQGFDRQGWKRLEILDAATALVDLAALHSNRLEALNGNRAGQYSIRINQQWRICFRWPLGQAVRLTSRSLIITRLGVKNYAASRNSSRRNSRRRTG